MFGGRFVILATLLVAVLLAGCTGPARDAGDEADDDPIVHTDPRDFNGTTDPDRFHLHDYWSGATLMPVMEETARVTVTTMGSGLNRWQFRPPSGSVVPLGTANVTVTLSWEADPDTVYGPVHLYVKTQADDASEDAGVVTNGEPFVFASTNDRNDLPHQLLSAWSFDLFLTPDPATGLLRFNADVSIEVVAERGLDIPLFPPHEDPWKNETVLPLFADQIEAGHVDHPPAPNRVCTGGCLPTHVPVEGAVVPLGTETVRVTLTVAEDAVGEVALAYHAADERAFQRVEPTSVDGAVRVYDIAAEGRVDGPYAASSLWEFRLETVQTNEVGSFEGSYTIDAVALRAAQPGS